MKAPDIPVRKSRAAVAQPPQILAAPEALLNIETVKLLTGLSRETIYRRIRDNTFPGSVKLTARSVRWRASTITTWLKAQGSDE